MTLENCNKNWSFIEVIIEYKTPLILPGFTSPIKYDYVIFEDEDSANLYKRGELSYDYLDCSCKLNTNSELVVQVNYLSSLSDSKFNNQELAEV